MKESEEEGEGEEAEKDIMDMTREIGEEKDTREKDRRAKRPVRPVNIAHDLPGSSPEKAEGKEGSRKKNRYQERRERGKEIITRRFIKGMREDTRTEDIKCEISHIAFQILRSKRMW